MIKTMKSRTRRNEDRDLVGARKSVINNAPCYRFFDNGRVQKTREILQDGTIVTCGQTKQVKNRRGTIILVRISVRDSSTGAKAWMRFADLCDHQR